jgi:hypothetical protein
MKAKNEDEHTDMVKVLKDLELWGRDTPPLILTLQFF